MLQWQPEATCAAVCRGSHHHSLHLALQVLPEGNEEVEPVDSPFKQASDGLVPVVRMEEVPQLAAFFPSGAPLVQLLVTEFEPPEAESSHLHSLAGPQTASIEVCCPRTPAELCMSEELHEMPGLVIVSTRPCSPAHSMQHLQNVLLEDDMRRRPSRSSPMARWR